MTALGLILGTLIGAGLLLLITGLQRRPPAPAAPTRNNTLPAWARLTRREQVTTAAAAAAGLLLALATGWIVLLLVLPVTALVLPRLFGGYSDTQIELLEALEKWTRALASVLAAHGSLQAALASTLPGCPPVLRPATERLVTRLRAGQPTDWAIREWLEEIDDVTGDLIGASLLLAIGTTHAKLRRVLNDLAEQVAAQVRARRQVEAERSGPIREARALTILAPTILAGFVFFTDIGRFYLSGSGQLLLLIVLAAFLACLWGIKRAAHSPPTPRFMKPRTLNETTQ